MKRSLLLESLLRKASLPAGKTVVENKTEANDAWRRRQDEIHRENYHRATGRYAPGFVG